MFSAGMKNPLASFNKRVDESRIKMFALHELVQFDNLGKVMVGIITAVNNNGTYLIQVNGVNGTVFTKSSSEIMKMPNPN